MMPSHTLRTDVAVGFHVAAAEMRNQFRRNLDSRTQKALVVLAAPMILLFLALFFQQAYELGAATRTGTAFPVLGLARTVLVPVMLVLSLFTAMSAMQSLARDSVRPLLLTSVSGRALLIGKLLYTLYTQLILFGFVSVLVVGYAVGAGAPLFLLAFVAAALPVLTVTLSGGLSLGYLFWLGTERLGISERLRRLITASVPTAVFIGWIALTNVGGENVPLDELANRGPITPLGWYADLLFVGSPVAEPVGLQTVLAAVAMGGLVPVVFGGLVRLAPAYWYATPVDSSEETTNEERTPSLEQSPSETIGRLSGSLFARSRTMRAAHGYARDAYRRPDQFLYLFTYLFLGGAFITPALVNQPESAPELLGGGLVLFGIFLGAVFCLNPLGSEGKMLPQLALAAVPADTFVHGRLLVAVAVGLPVSMLGIAVLGTGIVSLPVAFLGAGLLPVALVTSICFALGIGSAFPSFETGEVFNVETLKPSRIAVYIHAGITVQLVAVGAGVSLATATPGSSLSIPARLGSLGAYVLVAGLLADGSRRYAVAKLDDYGQPVVRVDRPFAVQASLGLAVLSVLFAQVVALFGTRVLGVESIAALFVFQYLAFALIAVGFLYVTRRSWDYLDVRMPSRREVGLVAGTLLGSLVIAIVGTTILSGLDLPGIDNSLSDPTVNGDSVADVEATTLLLVVLAMVLVVGPIEELLYRNIIQKYLSEWFATPAAVAIASVVFTFVHVPSYFLRTGNLVATGLLLSVLFVVSCLWGVLFARTRNLVVVAAVHGLYNASLVCLVVIGPTLG
jgi:membrane protease YdiL (CAAX protease family)